MRRVCIIPSTRINCLSVGCSHINTHPSRSPPTQRGRATCSSTAQARAQGAPRATALKAQRQQRPAVASCSACNAPVHAALHACVLVLRHVHAGGARPGAELVLGAINAERLWLQDAAPQPLHLASAMLCSRPVQAREAALAMLGIPTVHTCTRPPTPTTCAAGRTTRAPCWQVTDPAAARPMQARLLRASPRAVAAVLEAEAPPASAYVLSKEPLCHCDTTISSLAPSAQPVRAVEDAAATAAVVPRRRPAATSLLHRAIGARTIDRGVQ